MYQQRKYDINTDTRQFANTLQRNNYDKHHFGSK